MDRPEDWIQSPVPTRWQETTHALTGMQEHCAQACLHSHMQTQTGTSKEMKTKIEAELKISGKEVGNLTHSQMLFSWSVGPGPYLQELPSPCD